MAKGDPQVKAEVKQWFINHLRDVKVLKKGLVSRKRSLDGGTAYDIQVLLRKVAAEVLLMDANLMETIRVRTLDQPTAKPGGRRVKKLALST